MKSFFIYKCFSKGFGLVANQLEDPLNSFSISNFVFFRENQSSAKFEILKAKNDFRNYEFFRPNLF